MTEAEIKAILRETFKTKEFVDVDGNVWRQISPRDQKIPKRQHVSVKQ